MTPGATAARPAATSLATVAMVLNDDDYLMHDAVERVQSLCALHPEARLFGSKAVYFYSDEYLSNHRKLVTESLLSEQLHVRVSLPAEALAFRTGREIDMCHSGSAFYKDAWREVGGYRPQWNERVIGYADRDFQIRVNALFPIAVVENAAFAFWRVDSSVDQGLFSRFSAPKSIEPLVGLREPSVSQLPQVVAVQDRVPSPGRTPASRRPRPLAVSSSSDCASSFKLRSMTPQPGEPPRVQARPTSVSQS